MAARGWRWRAWGLRTGPKQLESQEEAAARLEEKRRAGAARLSRVRRLLEPPGPPERTLSRRAMEQMRYLRRDSPEEWPVSRLARSFEVSPDVVGRVLRSRFSPSRERALEQDSRLQPRPGGGVPAPPPARQLLPLCRAGGPEALAPEAAQRKGPARRPPPPAGSPQQPPPPSPAQEEQPPLRVVRKGREFVDGRGNLLYRIPA